MHEESANRLLSCLSEGSRDLILAQCTAVDLPLRTPMYESEKRPLYAYFMTDGMASVVMTTEDGDTAEVGIIAREGIVGGIHLIGPAKVSTSAFMQIEGSGLRLRMTELRKIYLSSADVRERVVEFQQEQALVVSQVAGCNRLHEVEARLARWLLMARDQTGSATLNLTQEFLGMMLGARRTTVSLVAGTLQRLGLIEFSRGRVRIVDGPGLEDMACDCYTVVRGLHAELYTKHLGEW